MTLVLRHPPRSIQAGLIAAALFILIFPAVQPLLQGQLPLTADGTLHLYRLTALDHALQGNHFQPASLWIRYVPGLAYGYGAPLFNYYSPLSLYPSLVLHQIGMTYLNAWLAGMVLYTFIAALGAYLFAAAWGGAIAGMVAAAAYIYAPYTLFDMLWRGTTAEYASLAILPLVFWALTRLIQTRQVRFWLLTAILYAVFIPLHNVITLHGSVLLGMYGLMVWLIYRPPQVQQAHNLMLRWGSGLVVGLLMAAFFWMPAITETRYVKLDAITATLPVIDVVGNLTPLSRVLALPVTADPTQLQPPLSISLGWVAIGLGAAGIVIALAWPKRSALLRAEPRLRWLMAFGLLAIVVLVLMNTPLSAGIWRLLPLIRYSQFPWRLLGLASLMLALLAGVGAVLVAERVRHAGMQLLALAVMIIALVLYGFPYLYPVYLTDVNPRTISDVQDFERESGFITTSSFGEYLPVWNEQMPDETALISRFEQADIIPRLRTPAEVEILSQRWGSTSGRLQMVVPAPTRIILEWFFVPGWEVKLDGEPIDFYPSLREGLIEVPLPEGEHVLEIALHSTDIQRAAWLLSVVGLIGLIAGGVRLRAAAPASEQIPYLDELAAVRPLMPRNGKSGEFTRPLRYPHYAYVLTTLAAGVLIIALKLTVIDSGQTFIKRERFRDGEQAGVPMAVQANFDRQLYLIGSSALPESVASGDTLPMTLYWRLTDEAVMIDYSSVITLRDSSGEIYTQQTDWQPGGLSTRHWMPGYYIAQQTGLRIPPGTPPAHYTLETGLYDPVSATSLEVINAEGNPIAQQVTLGTVNVTLSGSPASPEAVSSDITLNADLVHAMRLIGMNRLPADAQVGQSLSLVWVWQSLQTQTMTSEAQLAWAQATDIKALSASYPPVANVQQWREGETLRGRHTMYVPGDLESGTYDVLLIFEGDTLPLGEMTVTAPPRTFIMPEIAYPVDVTWDHGIRLLGYDIRYDGTLTLYWQAETAQHRSLSEFVHLVDDEGLILDQFAGVPAGNSRPIPGWAKDEIIVDAIPLALPPDSALHLRLGWFNPRSGERVLTQDGKDAYEISIPETVRTKAN